MKAFPSMALLLSAAPALAQDLPPDRVAAVLASVEAGIICAQEIIATNPAPDTVAGITNVIASDPEFVSEARRVPAVIGVGFGVRARSLAIDYPFVTMVVTHPPMGPGGVTRQSFETAIAAEDGSLAFYQLEYDYELVAGRWTFAAMDGDKTLYEVAFDVAPPGQVPELAGICGYEDLLF